MSEIKYDDDDDVSTFGSSPFFS